MTIALWCVLVAVFLPMPFTMLAKSGPGFDNARPREYLEQTTDWRKRAHWVQQNSFEAFPSFAAAVIIAQLVAGPQHAADLLAMLFVIARLAYGACYLANRPTLRSLMWTAGIGCVVGLFVVAARAA